MSRTQSETCTGKSVFRHIIFIGSIPKIFLKCPPLPLPHPKKKKKGERKKKNKDPKSSHKLLTCLKTQTVNSIPNCFNLDVVPLPVKFKNSRNQRKISIRASGHTLSMKLRKFIKMKIKVYLLF
jgi:hypothetical protein